MDQAEVERGLKMIHLVGVELEGGWVDRPPGWVHDGSVNAPPNSGELPLPPVPYERIEETMLPHYPDRVNRTCGLHVHISFKGGDHVYRAALDRADDMENRVVGRLKEWGKERNIIPDHSFWRRLAGENQYCRLGTDSKEWQVRATVKGAAPRYSVLNFCWRLHGTVEVRILPMFKKPNLAVDAVKTVVRTVAECLASAQGSEATLRIARRARRVERVPCQLLAVALEFRSKASYVRIEAASVVTERSDLLASATADLSIRQALSSALSRPGKRVALPMIGLDRVRSEVATFTQRLDKLQLVITPLAGTVGG